MDVNPSFQASKPLDKRQHNYEEPVKPSLTDKKASAIVRVVLADLKAPAASGSAVHHHSPASVTKHVDPADKQTLHKLQETYSDKLPQPGRASNDPDSVIVWRGCKAADLVKMVKYGSAGGIFPNPEAPCPSEKDAIAQVAEVKHFPEFTFNPMIAEGFGRNEVVAAFKIDIKYLTRGSVSEKGVIAYEDAPVTVLKWKMGGKIRS